MTEEVTKIEDLELKNDPDLAPREETDLITFDQLFENLKAQHAIKYDRYLVLKSQVDAICNKPQQGNNTFDLREVQALRDEVVKIEGGLDALNLFLTQVKGEEARNYVEIPKKPSPKVRVKGKAGFEDLADWVPDPSAPDVKTGV